MEITLRAVIHRQQEWIAVEFEAEESVSRAVKQVAGRRWSRSLKVWLIPLDRASHRQLMSGLAGRKVIQDSLREYLLQRKKEAEKVEGGECRPASFRVDHSASDERGPARAMRDHLQLKGYSPSTVRTYVNEFRIFLKAIGSTSADAMGVGDIKQYLLDCLVRGRLSENTLHSRINALKFYYEQVLGREKFFWEIPRPRKPMQLPNVLGERELERMFRAVENLKHKALLFTAYSAGLRVSEVVGLRLEDIDSGRMEIFVRRSKGKKDRVVGLSVLLLDVLRAYIKASRPRPMRYLFEGEEPGQPYSVRSAQAIFNRARRMAGISKDVSFHSLRHSFATHLLEKGIDIRYIKDILGHFSIKTTERYLHVRRDELVKMVNPLDELFRAKSWK